MPPRRTWVTFLIILAVNFLLVRFLFPGGDTPIKVPYTLFKQEVTTGNVARIYSRGESLTGQFRRPVTYPTANDTAADAKPRTGTTFATTLPAFVDPGLEALLIGNGVEISAEPIEGSGNPILTFLFGFGNVWTLALKLGVSGWVAPLVAPAVDLSVLALLLAIRYLALYGAPAAALRPARRLLLSSSLLS